jgi:glycosyltransferase involved in cell wall biosynthesis
MGLKGMFLTPAAFSGAKPSSTTGSKPGGILTGASTLHLRSIIRHWLGPLTLPRAARRLAATIEQVQPDLIHAMRIPYEGMLASEAVAALGLGTPPLLLSVWGNDFTLHAPSSPLMGNATRRALRRASALHTDCQRDIRLARQWGLDISKSSLVTPGNGGIRMDVFHRLDHLSTEPAIVNPRGFRAYVRNDTFFNAIPQVLEKYPQARFKCSSMAGESKAIELVAALKIQHAVELLEPCSHESMAALFQSCSILVSPSIHDGTPNSLLEGMACGCFPVAGDLESIREWISPGENGFLIDPADPHALAEAIMRAIENPGLRAQAAERNAAIIAERAEYRTNMARVESFYKMISE